MGEHGPAEEAQEAEAAASAVDSKRLDRWPAEPSYLHLRKHCDCDIEQDFHDLKEVEGLGQQQVRDVWANVGAFHVSAWVHALIELWAWGQPQEAICARSESVP
jgi:hypothetical protein